jgi:hypothetical protein
VFSIIFLVKNKFYIVLDILTLKTLGTSYAVTWHHIPEEQIRQNIFSLHIQAANGKRGTEAETPK